ncbi:L-aspartate oxidase [Salibacterium salarium]|uniref:L-aspartate oxidase n=2 Tax=Salibacterium salarium TaxID=284579 RepID=A0A428NAC1_9BACI|nr:L-aspartate oxidase [Salibacterium salarium]
MRGCSMENPRITTDIVIIGSGMAGLIAALQLSQTRKVTIVTKTSIGAGNSEKAQGGIAAAISANDSFYDHIQDTLAAGYGHNNERVAKKLIEQAAPVMSAFFDWNTPFDRDDKGVFQLAKEGAHSRRRIFHAGGDATGFYMMKQLKKHVAENIQVLEHFMAYDLLMAKDRCIGVMGKNKENQLCKIYAGATVIASGGCGQLYPVTSNAEEATSDGMAMAFRAGVRLKDMEFMQFHPTMLFSNGRGAGLVSEAVRGEGGILVDEAGNAIMKNRHPLEDLAPRSVVSNAVFEHLQAGKEIYLSTQKVSEFTKKFPTVADNALAHGIDVTKGFLPVRPGAHFMMGGIETNEWGRTNKNGVYAIGEAACTGMHGANRLASNSLLEAAAGALLLAQHLPWQEQVTLWEEQEEACDIGNSPEIQALQENMDQWAGVVKEETNLLKMREWLKSYNHFIFSKGSSVLIKKDMTLKNMMTTAWLITNGALVRTESRGAHIRTDYSDEEPEWVRYAVCWENEKTEPVIRLNQERGSGHEPAIS